MTPHMGHMSQMSAMSGGYAGTNMQMQPMHTPQEMDATTTVAQELDSGEHHHHQQYYSPQEQRQQAVMEQQQSPTYGHDQLGIQR